MLPPHAYHNTRCITNAAGTHLATDVRALQQPAYRSKFHFHLKPFTITRDHRRVWNIFLNSITTTNPFQLRQSLGVWTSTPSTHRPFRLANGAFYVQHDDEKWYRHLLSDSQRATRSTYRKYSFNICHQQDLPSPNTIVDATIRGEYYFVTIPLGDVALPLHLHTGDSPPQSPVGSARDFESFVRFCESNIAKFVVASSSQIFFAAFSETSVFCTEASYAYYEHWTTEFRYIRRRMDPRLT